MIIDINLLLVNSVGHEQLVVRWLQYPNKISSRLHTVCISQVWLGDSISNVTLRAPGKAN